ncbi:proline-rich transmembrane protein 3 [Discoglossus pictus]
MAASNVLRTWIFLAVLVVIEPATSVFDAITDPKHEALEDNPTDNQSSKYDLNIQKMAFPSEETAEDGLSQTKSSGKVLSTPASIRSEKEPDDDPEKRSEDTAFAETRSMANVRSGNEESRTANLHLKKPSDLFTKNLGLVGKHDNETNQNPSNATLYSHSMDESGLLGHYMDHGKDGSTETLSTVQPTVSTIELVASTQRYRPTTPIQKLQIESVSDHLREELSQNTVEDPDNKPEDASEVLKEVDEEHFLDDNFFPQMPGMQSSETSQAAAYRTTEGYATLQDTGSEGNEVISADVDDLHVTEDHVQYQKDSNSLDSAENKTEEFSVFFENKQRTGVDPMGQTRTTSNGPISHLFPSTQSLNQEPPVLLLSLDKDNMSQDVDDTKQLTLEAKARMQTERIPATTLEMKEVTNDNEASLGGSANKAHSHEVLSSLQPQETPTPAMQVLGKNSDKLKEPVQGSAQPGKGALRPTVTARGPDAASAPPGLVMSTTWRMLVPRPQDPPDMNKTPDSKPPQNGDFATDRVSPNITKRTGRRGDIIVTTQRAVQKPRLIEAPTSHPSKKPIIDTVLCTKAGGTCEFLGANRTLLQWDHLHRTLSFAWDMHVYGTGILFVLLSVIAMVNLIGSPILRVPYLPYIVVSNALLFIIGVLRGTYFFLDPYGTKSKISHGVSIILYNVTFPLILTTFATLVLLVLKIAHLELLPDKIQNLALLAVVGVIHFIILLSADLLTHLLNPSVNIVLQILSVSWGLFLMVGTFVAYYRLRTSNKDIVNESQRVSPTSEDIVAVQTQGRNLKCLFTSSRVLLVSSVFGLLCCGLQVYAILWLYGLLGKRDEFSWSWWFVQFWFRIFELALCFSMMFVASHSFCLQCSATDHSCWSKIISYFCTYNKTEIPEYPNNCYDWTNSIQERVVNNNINKSLIRNQPETVPLRIMKENNETKTSATFNNNSTSASPLARPKPEHIFGPKSQNLNMGRSYTSICFEKESMLSLADLEFRPPSPINLSRSIDEALFREHLVRDSIFLDSSLQYPSYLSRQDSCSSLKDSSALHQTVDPLISSDLKMRRCSNPDYLYSLAKHSSETEVDSTSESVQQSNDLPRDITTEAVASVSSLDSVSKGSIKISWNPWKHGLSSVESLPMEDTPSTQLLKQGSQHSIPSKGSEPEKIFGRRLIERSQTTDSHSIASDTIEL